MTGSKHRTQEDTLLPEKCKASLQKISTIYILRSVIKMQITYLMVY